MSCCHHWTPITRCHWKPCMLWSTMFHRWTCMLWIMSCSKPSPYFFLLVILVPVDLNFSRPTNTFAEVVWLFRCFSAKSNLALFAPCGEQGLLSWSLLFIVDFDSDTATSWKVFFTWLMLWNRFYHGEDPPIIHHCCPPWTSRPFYVAELTSGAVVA